MAMAAYKEAMNSGKLYKVMEFTERDPHYREYLQQIEEYNRLGYSPEAETAKQIILRSLFAEVGDGAYIQAPYHAMWGGHHVHLGRNVWIASNVTVLPGAHIGDNAIIGAGSIVTKDVPANIIAMGSPAKIVREITPDDDVHYDHGQSIADNIVTLDQLQQWE